MSKILYMITDGLTAIADAYVSPRAYIRPSRNGFQQDQAKLRGDVVRVGKDMKKAITTANGKQPNKRTSG
jgi:hypothetical protein